MIIPILQGWRLRHKRLLLAQDNTVVSGGAGSLTLDGALHTARYYHQLSGTSQGCVWERGWGCQNSSVSPMSMGPCLCWLTIAFQSLALNTYLMNAVVRRWVC